MSQRMHFILEPPTLNQNLEPPTIQLRMPTPAPTTRGFGELKIDSAGAPWCMMMMDPLRVTAGWCVCEPWSAEEIIGSSSSMMNRRGHCHLMIFTVLPYKSLRALFPRRELLWAVCGWKCHANGSVVVQDYAEAVRLYRMKRACIRSGQLGRHVSAQPTCCAAQSSGHPMVPPRRRAGVCIRSTSLTRLVA